MNHSMEIYSHLKREYLEEKIDLLIHRYSHELWTELYDEFDQIKKDLQELRTALTQSNYA